MPSSWPSSWPCLTRGDWPRCSVPKFKEKWTEWRCRLSWAQSGRDVASPGLCSHGKRERRSDLWPAIRPSTTTIYVVQTTEILSTGVNYAYMLCFCYLHLSRQYCSDYNSIITRKRIFTNSLIFTSVRETHCRLLCWSESGGFYVPFYGVEHQVYVENTEARWNSFDNLWDI